MRPDIQKICEEANWLAKDAQKIADELYKMNKPLTEIKHKIAKFMQRYSRLWADLNEREK